MYIEAGINICICILKTNLTADMQYEIMHFLVYRIKKAAFTVVILNIQGPISQRDLSPDLDLNLRLWS